MLTNAAWAAFDRLLDHPAFRRRAAQWVVRAQGLMGIGAGTAVDSSGESAALELVRSRSQGSLCIFDVGANCGEYAELSLQVLKEQAGAIHSFEPSPVAFGELTRRLHGQPAVHLVPVALGETREQRLLYADQPGSPLASLTKRNLDHFGIAVTHADQISVTTVDAYCAEHGVERIDLLKLDVEGHELDVLRGARRMLAERRIRLLTFEFGGTNIDTRTYVRDFFELLMPLGANGLYRIMPRGRLFHLPTYDETLEAFRTTNFLVVLDPTLTP